MSNSPRKFTGESMYTSKFGPRTTTIPRSPSATAALKGASGTPVDFNSTNGSVPSPRRASALAPLDASKLAGSVTEQYLARKKKDTMADLIAADVQAFQEEEAARIARRRQIILEQRSALQDQISARQSLKAKEREEGEKIGRLNREVDEASRRSVSEARRHQLDMRRALNEGMDEQNKELKERRARQKEEAAATAAMIVADAQASKKEEDERRLHKKIVQEQLNRQMMQDQDNTFKKKNETREQRIEEERKLLAMMDERLAREEVERKEYVSRRQRDISGSFKPLDHKAEAEKEKAMIADEAKRTEQLLKSVKDQQHQDKLEAQRQLQNQLKNQLAAAEAKKKKEREEALAERDRAEADSRRCHAEDVESKSVARQRAAQLRNALEDQMSDRLKREFNLTEEEFAPISPARRQQAAASSRGATPRTPRRH